MSSKSALLLLPNLLDPKSPTDLFLPSSVNRAMETIDGLIAESETNGRNYLGKFSTKKPAREIPIAILNKHRPTTDFDFLLEPIVRGERWGLISDAGLPCIADPGSGLVFRARQKGLEVQAFVGPSSLSLALMLGGLPSQKFTFHGYFPREEPGRRQTINQWIKQSSDQGYTQIFIETPYRNPSTLDWLIRELPEHMLLAVAWDLTSASQGVISCSIAQWKRMTAPNLKDKPAIYLFNKTFT